MPDVHALWAEHISIVSVHEFSANTDAAAINLALADIAGANRILEIPNTDRLGNYTNWTIGADVTIPANVILRFGPGSVLSIQPGSTWTQNGPVWAGPYQIWDTTPGGVLAYNAPGIRHDQWDGGSLGTNAPINAGVLTTDILRVTAAGGTIDLSAAPGDPENAVIGSAGDRYTNPGPPASHWLKVSGTLTDTDWQKFQVSQTNVAGAWLETITDTAAVPPVGVLQFAVPNAFPAGSGQAFSSVGRIDTTLGGPANIALGDPAQGDDIWTPSMSAAAGTQSLTSDHLPVADALFIPAGRDVLVTALGGTAFTGTGQITVRTRAARLVF